jgi:hypothetical protein
MPQSKLLLRRKHMVSNTNIFPIMKNIFLIITIILFGYSFIFAATPTLVQHFDMNEVGYTPGGNPTANGLTNGYFTLPNPTLSGNCLILVVGYDTSSNQSISSITDDKSNTYTSAGKPINNSTNHKALAVFVAPNVTAGAQKITVNFSASTPWVWAKITEFYNVATSSPVDVYQGTVVSGSSTISSGSITPSTSGDLLYQVAYASNATTMWNNNITFSPGSQSNITWALVPGSTQGADGTGAQYGVYSSTSSINPTFTSNKSETWVTATIALKTASAGTAPGFGIRIVAAQHVYYNYGQGNTLSQQHVSVGNLQVALSCNGPNNQRISGSASGTWNLRANAQYESGSNEGYAQIFDAVNVSPMTETVTISNTTAYGPDILFLDITGAASSPYGTYSMLQDQDQTSDTGTLTTVSITPTTSNGLIVAIAGINVGACTGSSGVMTNQSSYVNPFPGTGDQPCDQKDCYGIYYNPNTSSVTFTWTITGTSGDGVLNWSASAVAYKPPPAVRPAAPTGLQIKQ